MNRIDRLLSGFVFGLSVFAVAAIAAPTCYNITYQACTPKADCGVNTPGRSVKVCESSYVPTTGGKYKGTLVGQPRKCYTFSPTYQADCATSDPTWGKIPNCDLGTGNLCCFYPLSSPPTPSDGTGEILRLDPIEPCIGTGTPTTPY